MDAFDSGGAAVNSDLFANPADTREEILAATYRALCTHGYADLTIQRIGAEFEKSQSLIYHHYEDKDALVLACLEFMLEQFEAAYADPAVDRPRASIESTLDDTLSTDLDADELAFRRTLIDLRGQLSHEPAFRAHFSRSDRTFEAFLVELLEMGIERGSFRPIDPDRIASVIFTTVSGAFYRDATSDGNRAWLADVRTELQRYLETRVYASETDATDP